MTSPILAIRGRSPYGALLAFLGIVGCRAERIVTHEALQAGITVQPQPTSDLLAVTKALGWKDGTIPGATVIVQRSDPSPEVQPADTIVTDITGVARFADVPFAKYSIRVTRDLTTAERQRLAGVPGGVYALEGVTTITLNAAGTSALVAVGGVYRGSLVISEVFAAAFLISSTQYYDFGDFIEIYNNSDTTISIAGKLFLDAFPAQTDVPDGRCTDSAPFMGDPLGLWAEFIWRFPDDADPLPPGKTAVIATDAIDHRQFGTSIGLYDLSHAEYEFRGSQDTDNPLSKDMLSVGPRDGGFPDGHGWHFRSLQEVFAIAEPLNLDTLPRMTWAPGTGGESFVFLRVPVASLLDVVQRRDKYKTAYPPCPRPGVAPSIDRDETQLIGIEDSLTGHRRARYTLPNGQVVLQVSHSSLADFFRARGNPGIVP